MSGLSLLFSQEYSIRFDGSGELLLDQQRFQDAVVKFERAVELEKVKYVFVRPPSTRPHILTLLMQISSQRPTPRQQRPSALPMETRHRRRRTMLQRGFAD